MTAEHILTVMSSQDFANFYQGEFMAWLTFEHDAPTMREIRDRICVLFSVPSAEEIPT